MYKKLFFVVATMVLAACSDKDDLISLTMENSDNATIREVNARQVTNSQVKKFSDAFANCFANSVTTISKASKVSRTLDNIQYVVSDDKDTLMYILNYSNDSGYIILSANKEDSPILAMSDNGNIHLNQIDENSPFAAWLNEKIETISSEIKIPLDSLSELNVWSDLESDSCETTIEIVPEIPQNEISKSRNLYSSGRKTCYPIDGIILKWGQGTGYNYNGKYYGANIGCPAVAIGMLCYKNRYPYKYNYIAMPNKLTNYNSQNAISLMFRDIANNIPNYIWGKYVGALSGATSENILIGLRNIGYKKAQLKDFNLSELYQNLYNGNAVLLRADGKNVGHIWFCDGYKEVVYKVTKTRKRLFHRPVVTTWYEYEEQLYMNWGWDGMENGWYVVNGKWSSQDLTHQKKMYVNLTK